MECPLCKNPSELFFSELFLKCTGCKSIFRNPQDYPSFVKEKERYDFHQNNMEDPGYLEFVSPVIRAVKGNFSTSQQGLDFGSGPSSAISFSLRKEKYLIEEYDPFYQPDKSVLSGSFDYIVCCEVMEHFHHPAKEFQKLKDLLNKNGKLFCKTALWDESIDFEKWYYKNDLTHVFFYSENALTFIKETFNFSHLAIQRDLITFTN